MSRLLKGGLRNSLTILKWGPFGPATQENKNKNRLVPAKGVHAFPQPLRRRLCQGLPSLPSVQHSCPVLRKPPLSPRGAAQGATAPHPAPLEPQTVPLAARTELIEAEAPGRRLGPNNPNYLPLSPRGSSRGRPRSPESPARAGPQTHPKMTAFQTIMLFSDGAPLTPAGGSSCNLQKHTAAPLSPGTRGRPPSPPHPEPFRFGIRPVPRASSPLKRLSLTDTGYLLKSLMRRRRAGVDMALAGSEVGHIPGSAVPEETEEAEAEGAPRGTALPLRSRGSVWRRLSTTPE